jgi:hypothetical protein
VILPRACPPHLTRSRAHSRPWPRRHEDAKKSQLFFVFRVFVALKRYADRPMDFADATLVCLARRERLNTVFTVDLDDFETYRIEGRGVFVSCRIANPNNEEAEWQPGTNGPSPMRKTR